jgi:3-methyladenine DNA glycosylase/8-oxoguanine DNA glycosylase
MLDDDSQREIHLHAPFDLALTAGAVRRLPINVLYPIRDGELRVVMELDGLAQLIGIRQVGPQTLVYRSLSDALDPVWQAAAHSNLRRLLGLDVDLAPAYALLKGEPILGPLAERLVGLRPPRFLSLWETFVQVVPFQQVSLAAAITIVNRMAEAYGPRVRWGSEDYLGAPDMKRMLVAPASDLRRCGLSAAKAATLQGCAERLVAGDLREDELEALPDEEVAVRLRALPGIGPWSAQLILLRGLGRLGNFPAGDSGALRGLREVFSAAPDPGEAAAEALERLGDWRGYLYFMLLGRRLIGARG